MSVFTADERLRIIFCKELFDCLYRRVHLAFHIAGIVISAVMAKTFIVNQTGRVCVAEELGHFKNILASEGLISAGPDQDRRVVFVSLIHRICTVKHHIQPFRFVVRYNVGIILCKFSNIPGTVGFQVCLIDHIDSVFIAELIDQGCIRIMAGTDRIDIVLLHRLKVFAKFFFGYVSSAYRTEFMTVHALEYDTFSIQCHDAVFHFKTTESNSLRDHFLKLSCLIINFQCQVIKLWIFCAPEYRICYFPGINFFSVECFFVLDHGLSVFGKSDLNCAFAPGICSDLKCCCT